MNKTEFYNSVAKFTKSCGQGLNLKFAYRIPGFSMDMLNELIEMGLLKLVHQDYSYLPDDDWICLTGIYCVEEDSDNMFFMRYYLNFEDDMVSNAAEKLNKTREDLIAERIDRYKEFLNKNLEGLEAIKRINTDIQIKDELSQEMVTFLKEKTWYKNNLSVKESLEKCISVNSDEEKELKILKELNGLYKKSIEIKPDTYKKELEENEKELEETKTNLKLRTKLISILSDCKDKSTPVQELFSKWITD